MVRIYVDSTQDLSPAQIAENNIKVIPLYVSLGTEKNGRDGVEITRDMIYEWADRTKDTPKTAAFSPADAMDALEEAKEAGDDVIFIGISMDFSSVCNVVRLAAEDMEYEDHVFVVDSRNLSTGIGLVVLEAVKKVKEGKSAPEIVEHLNDVIPRVRASFIIDTLVYLSRGGRCSSVTALLAGSLKLRPMIAVKDGKMSVVKPYRGKRLPVLLKYAKDLEEQMLNAEEDVCFVTHSGNPEEEAEAVKEYVESLGHFKNVYITDAGSVISSHCGPATLGVLFIAKH